MQATSPPPTSASSKPANNNSNNNGMIPDVAGAFQTVREAITYLSSLGAEIENSYNNDQNKNNQDSSSISSNLLESCDFSTLFYRLKVLTVAKNIDFELVMKSSDPVSDLENLMKEDIDKENVEFEVKSEDSAVKNGKNKNNKQLERIRDLHTLLTDTNIMKAILYSFGSTSVNAAWAPIHRLVSRIVVLLPLDDHLRHFIRLHMLYVFKSAAYNFFTQVFNNNNNGDNLHSEDCSSSSSSTKEKKFTEYIEKVTSSQSRLEFLTYSFAIPEVKRFVTKTVLPSSTNNNCPVQNNSNISSAASSSFVVQSFSSQHEAFSFLKSRNQTYKEYVENLAGVLMYCSQLFDEMTASVANLFQERVAMEKEKENLAEKVSEFENREQQVMHQIQQRQNADNNNNHNIAPFINLLQTIRQQKQEHEEKMSQISNEIHLLSEYYRIKRDAASTFAKKYLARFEMSVTLLGNMFGFVSVEGNNENGEDNIESSPFTIPLIPFNTRIELCYLLAKQLKRDENISSSSSSSSSSPSSITATKIASFGKFISAFLGDVPFGLALTDHNISAFIASKITQNNSNNMNDDVHDDASVHHEENTSNTTTNPLVQTLKLLLDCVWAPKPTRDNIDNSFISEHLFNAFIQPQKSDEDNIRNDADESTATTQIEMEDFDSVFSDAVSYAAGIFKEIPFGSENNNNNNSSSSSSITKREDVDFQNLAQEFGLGPRWFLAASSCVAILMGIAPDMSEQIEHNDKRLKRRVFPKLSKEVLVPAFSSNLSEATSPTNQDDDNSLSVDNNNKDNNTFHFLNNFSSTSIAVSDQDWDLIGSWLIEGVTTGNLAILDHDETSNTNTVFNSSFVITPQRDLIAERISSLWIAAAHFCNFINSNNEDKKNFYAHRTAKSTTSRLLPHLLQDRSDVFSSWLFALAHRVIDLVSEVYQQQQQDGNNISPSLIFTSQVSVWAIEIFNKCAQIQPALVASVVMELWIQFESNIASCYHHHQAAFFSVECSRNIFITQFLASITSDSVVHFTNSGNNNNCSGDSNFSLKRHIEGILENIGNNKKEGNALVSIEFILNLFAKNFAAHGCAETMGEAVLRIGYGHLVCANKTMLSKSNEMNKNNDDHGFLDLLSIVDYLMKAEEAVENFNNNNNNNNHNKNAVKNVKERNLRKVQRTIVLFSSLIKITTSLLRRNNSSNKRNHDENNINNNHNNNNKKEPTKKCLLEILHEVLLFGFNKFFRHSELENTSNYLDMFFPNKNNNKKHNNNNNMSKKNCNEEEKSSLEDFLAIHLTNVAVDVLQLLSEPSMMMSNEEDIITKIHKISIPIVFNICNLFLTEADQDPDNNSNNNNNILRDEKRSWVVLVILSYFFQYNTMWGDASLEFLPNEHPAIPMCAVIMNANEAAENSRPLELFSLANSGVKINNNNSNNKQNKLGMRNESSNNNNIMNRSMSRNENNNTSRIDKENGQENSNAAEVPVQEDAAALLLSNLVGGLELNVEKLRKFSLGEMEKQRVEQVVKTLSALMMVNNGGRK